ncbi:MAG TPA: RNA polymerase sigma factor [Candidatus Syntrophosphaera sp.]|jgi:RNA polymerase sigma-70 factor (ECF subfamily)|nr:RNA polymerase sigma factor [Candidatus Syntrophosphaera sp.]
MLDLDAFVNLHERALFNFALHITRSEDEAEDLVQETWLKCLVHQQTLEPMPEAKQRSWLFTVLKNRWLDICRHRKLEAMVSSQSEQGYTPPASVYQLDAHLDKLPDLEREILRQKFWLDRNSREIAEDLGIPEGTVRWRLKCAMDKMRTYIEGDKRRNNVHPD